MPYASQKYCLAPSIVTAQRVTLSGAACLSLLLAAACSKKAEVLPPGEGANGKSPVQQAGKAPVDKPPLARAQASIGPIGASKVSGTLMFTALQDNAGVRVQGALSGLAPGQHGVHVHQNPDCSGKDGMAAGPHFNPTSAQHGAPDDAASHVGDLGNIEANAEGRATIDVIKKSATLGEGSTDLLNHSVIVHAGPDDLHSQPAGDAGGRIACGKIDKI